MPAPSPDPGNSDGLLHLLSIAFDTVSGLLLTIIAYLLNLYRRKVDDMQRDQQDFAKDVTEAHGEFVTREELDRKFVVMLDEHRHNHQDNKSEFAEFRAALRDDIRSVHDRIDDLFKKRNDHRNDHR